jgi:ribonuclease HI
MFLRVHSIADLTLAGGNHIDFSFLTLDPSLLSSASTLIEPLQDRPQTASALKLWQRANRLWCNTVTGGLHRPLGKWLVPGPQLRRVWPFYFDPDTETLWSKTGEGFNVHSCILSGRNRRNTQFHLQTNQHETTLPSNSFPVDCQETMTRLIITSQSSVITTDPPPMPNTPTFLANLLSWQQSLLDQLTTEHSHREILEMLQTSTTPPIIATDRSVKPSRAQGTFAWVLADQDGNPWLRCRGPDNGTPIDSFRSEAHALLSVLMYLNLLADYFLAPVSAIKVCIYTDSESNVKRIIQNRHRKRPEFPNETLSLSWDLHQAIHRELTNLPNVTIHYIKAHQDRTTSNAELSKEAKLNIKADKLAEEAYSSSTFAGQVPLIPGVSAQLSINGKTIVSKHRVIARDIR